MFDDEMKVVTKANTSGLGRTIAGVQLSFSTFQIGND